VSGIPGDAAIYLPGVYALLWIAHINVGQDRIVAAIGAVLSAVPGLKEYITSLRTRRDDPQVVHPRY
jgi:hypothetical protein